MKNFLVKVATLAIFIFVCFPAFAAAAPSVVASTSTGASTCSSENNTFFGLPTWYKYLSLSTDSEGNCNVDFNVEKDIPKIIFAIIEILTTLLGVIAVAMVVWGGFQYITSQGEPEATKNARNTIINALIGVGIAVSAVAIVNLIGNNLFK